MPESLLAPTARSLQARLMLAISGIVLALVSLYTLYALAFAYTVEDQFLARALAAEAAVLQAAYDRDGHWPASLAPHLRLAGASPVEALPQALLESLQLNPERREFAASDGRHYHIQRMASDGEPVWLVAEVSSQLVFRGMRATVAEILGYSALVALLGGLLVAWWVARRSSRPLRSLAMTVRQLDPQQLPQRLPVLAGGDAWQRNADADVVTLAHRLDELLGRIADTLRREQAFTRDASHELRTPLAVIRSHAELIAADPALPPRLRVAVEHIDAAARLQAETLDALLELARADGSATPPATALLPVIEQVIVAQSARRQREDLDFLIEVPPTAVAMIRPALLRILLANLIGNVFAHAEGGRVLIQSTAGRLLIRNAARPRQQQAPPASTGEGPGLGLGLSIVRRLDEQHRLGLRIDGLDTDGEGAVEASFRLCPDRWRGRGAVSESDASASAGRPDR